jgi:hypothetical protein
MVSIEERIDRAAARLARATVSHLRGLQLRRDSAWRINSSRLTLDYPGLARIRGGSDALSDSAVRERIRALIQQGVLLRTPPVKMFAGPSPGSRACSLCGEVLGKGEIEFETTLPDDRVVFFHRRCADLWLLETKREID